MSVCICRGRRNSSCTAHMGFVTKPARAPKGAPDPLDAVGSIFYRCSNSGKTRLPRALRCRCNADLSKRRRYVLELVTWRVGKRYGRSCYYHCWECGDAMEQSYRDYADQVLRPDVRRLDALEALVRTEGGLLLHDGNFNGRYGGLSLTIGKMRRTLREALDKLQ